MEGHFITTPFGGRSMSFAMFAAQAAAQDIEPGRSVDKWKLFRQLCEARPLLGISDRALAVLNALLTFYPKPELAEEHGLVVFPSNNQLSLRAHGMSDTTLRRHLAALVDAGLLLRKDSPNGKRYARQDRAGDAREAFGFSLAPLLARADEIEAIAEGVIAERLALQRLKERLSICRRDVTKLIETAMEEGAPGDWRQRFEEFRRIGLLLPRRASAQTIRDCLDELELFRQEIVNDLELLVNVRKISGNDRQNGRQIHNSNPQYPSESENSFRKEAEMLVEHQVDSDGEETAVPMDGSSRVSISGGRTVEEPVRTFPLAIVLQACPEIEAYGQQGVIGTWRDLMQAAVTVRSMLGVSPSAYQEACEVLGPENAATAIACILERAGHIQSAGGYLRDLTRKAARGEFSLGPMLMALTRQNSGPERKSA